jgi:hypothetical protein
MKRLLITAALLLGTAIHAHADQRVSSLHDKARPHGHNRPMNSQSNRSPVDRSVTVYNRDSRDPSVGWHTEGGMRVCHQDCDNPEIPGSGAVCKDIQAMGMTMRQCVTGSPL